MSRTLDQATSEYASIALLEPFGVPDHIVDAPVNTATTKFIKLTAGLDGLGQYNEGLLTNETITGADPVTVVTADIVVGTKAGATIHLLNSESRYVKPGVSSGTVANDQMQQITGNVQNIIGPAVLNISGAFTGTATSAAAAGGASYSRSTATFDSANSPDARTGTRTDTKHVQMTYYARIM